MAAEEWGQGTRGTFDAYIANDTSNFTPCDLGEKIGTCATSRIFRGNCMLFEVQAPDYALNQATNKI